MKNIKTITVTGYTISQNGNVVKIDNSNFSIYEEMLRMYCTFFYNLPSIGEKVNMNHNQFGRMKESGVVEFTL